MSDSEVHYESDGCDENFQVNFVKSSEDAMPSLIQNNCENTDVEITSLNYVNNELDSNNDYNDSNVRNVDDTNSSSLSSDSNLRLNDKNLEVCLICDLKIYPMEKLTTDGKLYHKNCFRCSKCRTILSVTNFNLNNKSIYCKTHFMELFKIRGKYDDDGTIENEIVSQGEELIEQIPSTDTKTLLEKFRQLESGSVSCPNSYSKSADSTVNYVNLTDDIVRSQDIQQDELPPPETAKVMVAKFKAMESKNIPTPERVQQMQSQAKAYSTSNANVRLQSHSIQTNQASDDSNTTDELPEGGTTRNLMSKFQNLSDNA